MLDDIEEALEYVREAMKNTSDEGSRQRLRGMEILLVELQKHREDVAKSLLSRKAF